jgi:predicted ester cyclase
MPLVQRFGHQPTTSGSERSAAVSAEDNESVVRRWIEAYNERDRQAEADLLAPGYVAHVPGAPGPLVGLEAWRQFSGSFAEAFPDLRLMVEDIFSAGEMVAARVAFRGTHQGEFQGMLPTGKEVAFSSIEINRVVGGKVEEHWVELDLLSLMQQLGAIPQPGSPGHEGGIAPDEISGRGSSEPAPRGGITPEEISGGRHSDTAPHEVGVPPEDFSGRTPPSSTPHAPRERGIPPEDVSGD